MKENLFYGAGLGQYTFCDEITPHIVYSDKTCEDITDFTKFNVYLTATLPEARRSIVERNPRVTFKTFISKHSSVSPTAQIGRGVTIARGAIVGNHVILEDYSYIGTGAIITAFAKVGKYSAVKVGAIICANATIGHTTFIGAGVVMVDRATVGDNQFIKARTLIKR